MWRKMWFLEGSQICPEMTEIRCPIFKAAAYTAYKGDIRYRFYDSVILNTCDLSVYGLDICFLKIEAAC